MFSKKSRRFVLLSNEYFILILEEWGTRTREAADREGAWKVRRVMQFLNLLNTQDNENQIKKMGMDKVQEGKTVSANKVLMDWQCHQWADCLIL